LGVFFSFLLNASIICLWKNQNGIEYNKIK
jgi:hypothetical protein